MNFLQVNSKTIFFISIAIILMMPFTISTLLTRADDEEASFESNEEYKKLEEELSFLNQKEQEVIRSIKGMVEEEQQEIIKERLVINNQGGEEENQKNQEEKKENKPDPATAPSQIILSLTTESGELPENIDEITVRFIGVGREPIEVGLNEKGEIEVELETGRYYTELESNQYYSGDTLSFFLLPNKKINLGEIKLIEK